MLLPDTKKNHSGFLISALPPLLYVKMIKKDFLDYNDGKIRLQQANLMMENNNRTQEDVDALEGLLLLRNENKIKTRRLPIISMIQKRNL